MKRFKLSAVVLILLLAGCSTPHKLPEAPTPIPTLAPALLPVPQADKETPAETGAQAEEGVDPGVVDVGDPAAGAEVFQANGCGACHALNGTAGVGPGLGGLFGSERPLESGGSVMADDAYLRKAIVEPGVELSSGFGDLMPASFGDILSEDEIVNLVAYLRVLGNE